MDNVIDFINVNRDRYLEELKAFLAIPSISALPQHAGDVKRCADWCADEMRRIGLQNVRLIDTPGNPVVYGDWLGAPGAPTILFYGHYDVQPVDPLELWESPPFEATIRDGEIYARGSADDKGQVFMHFKAVEAHLKQNGRLPVNMKFILEGEEEVGSVNLDDFIRAHKARAGGRRRRHLRLGDVRARRAVDLLRPARPRVFPDRPARQQHRPALRIVRRRGREPGVRAGADDRADEGPRRPHQDSGLLRRCACRCRRRSGRRGRRCRSTRSSTRRTSASRKLFGETGYTTLERTWARPTFEVNGLLSGFTGEGAKTVLPAVAMTKVSMRLVPNQTPDKIAELFEAHVRDITPKTVELKITRMHGGKPWMTSYDNPFVQAAGRAIERGFGRKPVFTREGGSIPVVSTFQEELGLPSVLFGVGLPDENAHAPNEKLDVANFHGGIISSAILYEEISKR